MKYDLIVIGGGPGGLVAAKTAAQDGLRVLLIERKKDITEINRICGQIFYLSGKHVGATESGVYCHRDKIKLEIGAAKNRFIFPQGFSVDYRGPLVPYYNFTHFSPSGYKVDRYRRNNDDPWGFFFQKEVFLAGLLSDAEKAGVEVLDSTIALWAEDNPAGIKVRIRGKVGEQTLEAPKAIAADGIKSVIVESLGFNKKRIAIAPPMKLLGYVMEGLEDAPRNSFLDFVIPSINPQTDIWVYMLAEGRMMVGTGPVSGKLSPKLITQEFMKYPVYAHWFRHARVVKTTAYANTSMLTPLKEPATGNVVIVGDAGAPYEALIQGAIACGYMAVKAIEKELNGQEGYREYIDYWQNAFEFNDPTFFRTTARYMFLNRLCSSEEVDYLYRLFQDKAGVPQVMIANNLELIRKDRPKLYDKLKNRGIDKLEMDMADVWES
jgi:flavin-dependent dehydrogenase